jgi:hypothetical protein
MLPWVVRRGWLPLVSLLAGCGRLGFDANLTALADAAHVADASDGGSGVDCWASWRSGAPVLSAPVRVAELATALVESDPSVSADGSTLYFGRGPAQNRNVYVAVRPNRGTAFGIAQVVPELDALTDNVRVTVTADGLTAIATSGTANYDLFQATRGSSTMAFGSETTAPFASINDANNQIDPELTPDGLRLYYAPDGGGQAVRLASRASVGASFGSPSPVTGLGGGTTCDPSISPDELVIAYARVIAGKRQLYFATRSTVGAAFGGPIVLPGLASGGVDGDPELTADGCELFFASDRGGDFDIYVVTVMP